MPSVAIIGTRGYPSYYGGFETAVRKLAPYLADDGWDVTVYSRAGATAADDPERDPRVRSIVTPGIDRSSWSTLSYGFTAARDAARNRPDVALVMNVANGFWLPVLKRAGIPTLVNVDGIEWERSKWGHAGKSVFRTGARWTAKHGDRLVYDSLETARRWREEFRRDGEYIPYGGDLLDRDLPLDPGLTHRGYVLMVTRLVPENSVEEFFEAARVISQHHDVVIVGTDGCGGALDDQARRLSQEHDRVHWLGHLSDDQRLHGLWRHAGVYFHGHSVGGTNPALVQAMACGAPVLARDTPFNREVLGPDGHYVEPDPGVIAAKALALMSSPRVAERASRANIGRAAENYSWSSVNRRYADALSFLSGRADLAGVRERTRA